uniref:F-box domain-containing protein n=1 Tax=Steinernema glaseri TaxID=37863 RepID=A0A1I7Y4F7_9BILA
MTRLTFRNKVLPALRSLAFDCTFDISKFQAFRQNLVDCVFTGLQACSQLSDIDVGNYGERCISFLRHQIDLGPLSYLSLNLQVLWASIYCAATWLWTLIWPPALSTTSCEANFVRTLRSTGDLRLL